MEWKTVEVVSETIVDSNPDTWYKAGSEELEKCNYQKALNLFEEGIGYAQGNDRLISSCVVKRMICFYHMGNVQAARNEDGRADVWNTVCNEPELLYQLLQFDKSFWDRLWGEIAIYKLQKRNESFWNTEKYINEIKFVNILDKYEQEDVKWLISKDNIKVISKFISYGEKVLSLKYNHCGIESNALMLAIQENAQAIVKYIIDNRIVNINEQNEVGYTALHYAVENNQDDIVESLITKGAKVNISDKEGYYPIDICIKYTKSDKTLRLLLDNKANVNISMADNKSTLMRACSIANISAVNLLLEYGADVNYISKSYDTPLFSALAAESLKCVEALINYGADINYINKDGMTPLIVAVGLGDYYANEIVEVLLNNGAIVEATDSKNMTALAVAIQRGNSSIVKVLLKGNANPNVRWHDEYGNDYTPLIYVAAHQHWDWNYVQIYDSLLNDKRIDVNVQDKNGWTALMHSLNHKWTFTDEVGMARALLNHGADKKIKAKDGYDAKRIVCERNISSIAVEIGVSKGALNSTGGSIGSFFNKFF